MIKTAKLPQGRFTTQGGRENIYYFKPFSLQPRRKRSALRYGFNPHDFERFFESPHHRQRPKAPREGVKDFGDHEKADG
ncbi:hypothetical protein UBN117_07280 [Helicobacter pylori]